ncbi:hypothetical protein L873DRAFT_1891690 [Choiromyces venosus 120613-1]|uniref:Uncharacterized protein n=1 Tax=Choiromyces venosus 120613-1 TaxID=1336337 RepID=A0A3N4JX17_9PEZI|nr:hypothetical protein L873DRAFT_1891690 [Choiromyces venosus 120613-1]
MVPVRVSWNRLDYSKVDDLVNGLSVLLVDDTWSTINRFVDKLPQGKVRKRLTGWWTPALEGMKRDVQLLCALGPGRADDYKLASCVYRDTVKSAQHDFIRNRLSALNDPDVFRAINKLDLQHTIPTLFDGDLPVMSHQDMSDLIMAQLFPLVAPPPPWAPSPITFPDVSPMEVGKALWWSPNSTSLGIDMIPYSFLQYIYRHDPAFLWTFVEFALEHDDARFCFGEVVLIPKADKLRYNITKSQRIIT